MPQEDRPFEVVASLEEIDADSAVPMEIDGERLSPAEGASVDLAAKEFARKVRTLADEADAVFENRFEVRYGAPRLSARLLRASWMQYGFSPNSVNNVTNHKRQPTKLASKAHHSTQLCEVPEHLISGFAELAECAVRRLVTKVLTRIRVHKVRIRWAETHKPKPPVKKAMAAPTVPVGSLNVRIFSMQVFSIPVLTFLLKPYQLHTTTADDDGNDDNDELEQYLLHTKPVPATPAACLLALPVI